MKKTHFLLIFIFLVTSVSGFEIAINNRGFEFGLNGKRHFKMLNSLEGYLTRDLNSLELYGFKADISLQWLNLRKKIVNINFLSGVFYENIGYEEYSSLARSGGLGLEFLKVETELKWNETGSVFIRGNLFAYNLFGSFSMGMFAPIGGEDIRWTGRSVLLGIRIRFNRTKDDDVAKKNYDG